MRNTSHPISDCRGVYHEIQFKTFCLSNNKGNQWFLTKEMKIVKFINATYIQNENFIYGAELRSQSDFYSNPLSSSCLETFLSNCVENQPKLYKIDHVKSKLFGVPLLDESHHVFFPLLHSL